MKPGPNWNEGAAERDDEGLVGEGGGRRWNFSSSPPKPKPNEVGGGLKAKVLLWENKFKKVADENCTDTATASYNGPNFGDWKRKQKDDAWQQNANHEQQPEIHGNRPEIERQQQDSN